MRWVALALAVAGVAWLSGRTGLPAPALLAAIVVGAGYALASGRALQMPRPVAVAGQAVLGASIGTYVRVGTLHALAGHLGPVAAVCGTTLALSLLSGWLLARWAPVDRVTASFSMMAGGATGLTAVSQELGADDRIVAVLQYTRVLIIAVTIPLVASLFRPVATGGGPLGAPGRTASSSPGSLALVAGCIAVGLLFARLARLPVGNLLGPMAVVAGLSLAHLPGLAGLIGALPGWLLNASYAVIGLQVGLRCSPSSLAVARRVLPWATALTAAVILACAGLGVLLSRTTHAGALDGYLATTPGGLYVVLATATGTHADPAFVTSVQVIRLLLMLVAAPLVARWLTRTGARIRLPRGGAGDPGSNPARRG